MRRAKEPTWPMSARSMISIRACAARATIPGTSDARLSANQMAHALTSSGPCTGPMVSAKPRVALTGPAAAQTDGPSATPMISKEMKNVKSVVPASTCPTASARRVAERGRGDAELHLACDQWGHETRSSARRSAPHPACNSLGETTKTTAERQRPARQPPESPCGKPSRPGQAAVPALPMAADAREERRRGPLVHESDRNGTGHPRSRRRRPRESHSMS